MHRCRPQKFGLWFVTFISLAALVYIHPTKASADQITYYVYPSPLGLNWKNPSTLTWDTIFNSLIVDNELHAIHAIGHMNFDVQCSPSTDLPNGAEIETGQTNSDDSQMNKAILSEGYGLGAAISDYSGVWENPRYIEDDLTLRYARGTVAFMNVAIRPATCARVIAYLNEYKAKGLDKTYGGLERKAREGLGAGCSSFAESVLEIAGIMAPQMSSSWSHTVNMQWSLIGGPRTGADVPVFDLLFGQAAGSWGKSAKDSDVVGFWDPDRAYQWIRNAATHPTSLSGMTYKPAARDNALGINVDATGVATPTDGFWIP